MTPTLSRRCAIRGLAAALSACALRLTAGLPPLVRPVGATQAPEPMPPSVAVVDEPIHSAPGTPNVWAATISGFAEAVVDLPARVYVPHENGGDVAVIDPRTRQVIDRFAVGRTPHHVTPAYDLASLYANVMGSNRLVQIDPHTARPVGSVPADAPYNLYFSLDGGLAIVAAERYNRLDFYEAGSWRPVARLPLPASGADHLDLSADGGFLLISGEFGGQLVKVDLQRIAVAGVLTLGGLPIDVKLAPQGDLFYVANQGRHGVSIVEPEPLREIAFVPTGRGAHGLAISRDTRYLYVSNRLAGSISVLDFDSRGVVDTWPIGGSPDMLQVSPDGTELWASGRSHGSVYVIDTSAGQLLERIRTGSAPHGLTYFPQPGHFSLGHNGVYR